jgi:hypothetical protein
MLELLTRLRFRQVFLFAAAVSAAILIWLFHRSEFEVRARILVQPGSEGLKTELTLLRGDVLAEQVLAAAAGAGSHFPQAGQKEQIRQLQKRLTAEPVSDKKNIIQIAFRHPQGKTARQTVEMLISVFRLQMQKMHPQPARLAEELAAAGQQMQQAEKRLIMLGRPDEADAQELAEQRRSLTQQAEAEQKKLQDMVEKTAALEQQYAGPDDGRDDLLRLKLYEQELLRKYEAHEPLIAEVRQQMLLAKEELRKSGSAGQELLADQIVEAKADYSRQKETVAAARKRLAQLDQTLLRLTERKNIFQKMQADLKEKKTRHAELLNRLAAGWQGVSVTVLEPPLTPRRTGGLLFCLLAAALGLSGGLAVCLLLLPRKKIR